MAPGETTFLGTIYAFGATLSFTVAHVSVIRLRKLRPLAERPRGRDGERLWRPPGNVRIRGRRRPADGGARRARHLRRVHRRDGARPGRPRHRRRLDDRRDARSTSPTAATRGCRCARRSRSRSLTPLGVEEVEYRSVLVAFDEDDPFAEEAVATAKALAARRRRAIHVLSLVNVPANLPLDAELDRARARRADEDRAGEADLRPAGQRPRRARPPRRRRAGDRRGGEGRSRRPRS